MISLVRRPQLELEMESGRERRRGERSGAEQRSTTSETRRP